MKSYFADSVNRFKRRSLARTDVELDQAKVRMKIEAIVLLYLIASFWSDGFIFHELVTISYLTGIFGVAILFYFLIKKQPGHYVWRRLAVAVMDVGAVTLFMHRGEETCAVLFPLYLWVTLGAGFRFGRRYLFFSQSLSILGFLYLYKYNSFWSEVATMPVFLITLIVIPLYATTLIGRLTEAAKKAQEASEEKSRFVSNISHEIRTPLHGIIGITELLSLRTYDEEYKTLCDSLSRSGHALLRLVNDVLDIAKIESGKLEIEKTIFDLHKLLEDTMEMFLIQAREKNIETKLFLDPEISRYWTGDPQHIQQVLINLIGNALKFTDKGTINLNVTRVDNDIQTPIIRFKVEDTGIGMSAEFLGRVFERFSRADIVSSARFPGTGLGTTISKQLIDAMGGSIGAESKQNVGSIFWFDLPLESAQSIQSDAVEVRSLSSWLVGNIEHRKNLTMLVAEDNQTNQMIISKILDKAGFKFDLVSDGEYALDAMLEKDYDVALVDMQMPGLTGIEICRAYKMIKANSQQTDFIMLSANVNPENHKAAMQVGFVACLPKPIEAVKLIEMLDNKASTIEATLKNKINNKSEASKQHDKNPTIDPAVLTELSIFSDDEIFLSEVVKSFEQETRTRLKALEGDLNGKRFGSLKAHAHAIRGTSVNVGAVAIAKIVGEIEKMNSDALPSDVIHRIPQLYQLLEESVASLRSLVKKLARKNASVSI